MKWRYKVIWSGHGSFHLILRLIRIWKWATAIPLATFARWQSFSLTSWITYWNAYTASVQSKARFAKASIHRCKSSNATLLVKCSASCLAWTTATNEYRITIWAPFSYAWKSNVRSCIFYIEKRPKLFQLRLLSTQFNGNLPHDTSFGCIQAIKANAKRSVKNEIPLFIVLEMM